MLLLQRLDLLAVAVLARAQAAWPNGAGRRRPRAKSSTCVASSAIFSLRRRPWYCSKHFLKQCVPQAPLVKGERRLVLRAVLSASAAELIVIREPQSKNIALVFTNLHQEPPGPNPACFLPSPALAPMGLVPYLVRGSPKTSTTQYREPEGPPWTADTAPSPQAPRPPLTKKLPQGAARRTCSRRES